jgi:hypothetical protein
MAVAIALDEGDPTGWHGCTDTANNNKYLHLPIPPISWKDDGVLGNVYTDQSPDGKLLALIRCVWNRGDDPTYVFYATGDVNCTTGGPDQQYCDGCSGKRGQYGYKSQGTNFDALLGYIDRTYSFNGSDHRCVLPPL